MTRYVALLRGINVGGRKLIKMDHLASVFASAGFKNVRTLIASGNVSFDAPEADAKTIAAKIEKKLQKAFGHEVPTTVRTVDELRALVKRNPFKQVEASKDVMVCVAFLFSPPAQELKFPLVFPKENLEILGVYHGAACIVARRKANGWFTFPHEFVEKNFSVLSTTRNWTTVKKLAAIKPD
ncbi:MAG TPA: DUF1697 domain-containing protein [Pyrinomonadaceae bacterium]|nr:DUF1697 domain-containing protein [Pyrinomonadaceae bacterium]